MVRRKVDRRAREIRLVSNSKREFFLVHGYTGSPTDFRDLGNFLHKKFNANVRIIRLRGHGEVIENLDSLNYNDFLIQAEEELKKSLDLGKEIVLGGLSVGSLIALDLAARYPVKGLFCVSTSFRNKFPLNIFSFLEPLILKKHWVKKTPECEKDLRKNAFFYGLHLRGLRVIQQGKLSVTPILKNINSPFLAIHVSNDSLFSIKGVEDLLNRVSSKIKKLVVIDNKKERSHNPFYSSKLNEVSEEISLFIEKNRLFSVK
jgi:esterase/lipase